jgi:hypothetical protein
MLNLDGSILGLDQFLVERVAAPVAHKRLQPMFHVQRDRERWSFARGINDRLMRVE